MSELVPIVPRSKRSSIDSGEIIETVHARYRARAVGRRRRRGRTSGTLERHRCPGACRVLPGQRRDERRFAQWRRRWLADSLALWEIRTIN
jgi:hypothetical protein